MTPTVELANKLKWLVDRAQDPDHPDGWLDHWSDETCELVWAAADALLDYDDLERSVLAAEDDSVIEGA